MFDVVSMNYVLCVEEFKFGVVPPYHHFAVNVILILLTGMEGVVEVLNNIGGVIGYGNEGRIDQFFVERRVITRMGGEFGFGKGGDESFGLDRSHVFFECGVSVLLSQVPSDFIVVKNLLGVRQISFWFPSIFSGGVTFPFDQILASFPHLSMRDYCLDFVFWFSFY